MNPLFLPVTRSSNPLQTMAASRNRNDSSTRRKAIGRRRRCRSIVLGMLLAASFCGCQNFTAQGRNAEGVRYFQLGQYQEALKEFQEASYADPTNPDSYYNLAATYHRLGNLSGRPLDLKQAEDLYNQCLDRKPDHCECYRGLAVLLAEQGRNDEAFRLLQGWVDRQPESANAKIELARLYEEMGERNAAKRQLIEAINAEPANARALAALGKIREDLGERSQALSAYQQALAQDPRQQNVAQRIAALQSSVAPPAAIDPGIRWVNGASGTLR